MLLSYPRILFISVVTIMLNACASSVPANSVDASTGYDVILLAGQSNMAGRGVLLNPIDADGATDAAISMWDPAKGIVEAKDPLVHPELGSKPTGVGLGMSFAKSYLAQLRRSGYPNRKILLVGAAWGGTSFIQNDPTYRHRWVVTDDPAVGGDLYRGAVQRANAAISAAQAVDPSSTFKGILWHQGEGDVNYQGAPSYAAKHTQLITSLREHIKGARHAPVVVGELTPCFISRCEPAVGRSSPEDMATFLSYLHSISQHLPLAAWVSSNGLTGNAPGDQIHFDLKSQRELGKRYFEKFWELTHTTLPLSP